MNILAVPRPDFPCRAGAMSLFRGVMGDRDARSTEDATQAELLAFQPASADGAGPGDRWWPWLDRPPCPRPAGRRRVDRESRGLRPVRLGVPGSRYWTERAA